MNSISDSDAVYDVDRLLAQHQAVLSLLQGSLSSMEVERYKWLDLATGRGQIIANLADSLSPLARAKIDFMGYDINNSYARIAERTAGNVGFKSFQFVIGELPKFHLHQEASGPWDFITLTNTIHEIDPSCIAEIIVNALARLTETGCLFIYDMEQLPSLELGAVTWTRDEINLVITTLCRALGAEKYQPEIGRWKHKSCNGWNAQLRPKDMALSGDWHQKMEGCKTKTKECIVNLLRNKFEGTTKALDSLTRCGAQSNEENDGKIRLLYDYWALSRKMGAVR